MTIAENNKATRLATIRDWAVLVFGAASLAFAILASSTAIVAAGDQEPAHIVD